MHMRYVRVLYAHHCTQLRLRFRHHLVRRYIVEDLSVAQHQAVQGTAAHDNDANFIFSGAPRRCAVIAAP